MLRFIWISVCVILASSWVHAQQQNREAEIAFERQVRPLLAARCVGCHGPKKQEAGLRLDSRSSVFAELDFGRALVAGDPGASRLIEVIQFHEDDIQMPPKGKLPEGEIQLLEAWVKAGAVWPAEDDPAAERDADAWQQHWAFQPIVAPVVPPVSNPAWPTTEIDHFILARIESAGLKPSGLANPRTLVRRASFDLIGLPPTLEAVEHFEGDPSEAAWTRLIDRLLASEHFGERWARHWMDVARYSDTTGYVFTADRKLGDAWKYRDWLIHAFNNDMPIDDFMVHQIAADRILPADAGDALAATGFLTLGRRFLNNRHDIIDDRIDVVTRGMMGFTVTCARCHDHKYDPVPSTDYYSLYGVFASSHQPDRDKSTVQLADKQKPFDPYVFVRGQPHNRGEHVPRRFLGALEPNRQPFNDGSGRRELAEAIASRDNPLTARVFVNRVWGYLFGSYLVDTPSDFGMRTSPPTHPELLDYLASTLIDNGWSLKELLREIMLSSVYRQSSHIEDANRMAGVDSENRLLSHGNRKRLDFEATRDSMLAVSGLLDRAVGGPSVDITEAPYPTRRTVYAYIDRQNLPGVFRAFDLANPDTHAPRRFETTVPQQGLFLLNNPFVLRNATALAKRTEAIGDSAERVRELFRLAYAREPNSMELDSSVTFIESAQAVGSNRDVSIDGWSYGYGLYDKATDRVARFNPYPVFAANSWRGSQQLPDPKIGWSMLNRTGGHPGNATHSAIRRWTVPADGTIVVRGVMKHPSKEGDGVIGRVVSSRGGQIDHWQVAHGELPTVIARIDVVRGETIDFVCESGTNENHDSFQWKVNLRFDPNTGRARFVSSEKDFGDRPLEPFDVWARYAQVLLLSNEFAFVD